MDEDKNNKIDVESFELTDDTKLAIKEFSEMALNANKTLKEIGLVVGSAMKNMVYESQRVMKEFSETIKNYGYPNIMSAAKSFNFDKVYLNIYATAIAGNKELIQLFYDNTIFPPLHYILNKKIELEEIQMPLDKWIQSEDIKLYYLARINKWKNKYKNKSVHALIDEIHHNLNENNYYSVTFLTSTLLEYLLNEDYVPTKDSKRYSKMKGVLKNEVFDYIDFEGLDEKFINKNLYCNTDKAEEFSRHTIHGTGLNMINHKTSFTIIFLYDFFERVLKIKEGK